MVMAPAPKIDLPTTEGQWQDNVNAHKVKSIHEFEVRDSGSKITANQFLALKTIWQNHDQNAIVEDKWARLFDSSKTALLTKQSQMAAGDAAWKAYLEALGETTKPKPNAKFSPKLGRFATVLQNQLEVNKLKETSQEFLKVALSPPVSGRTRAKLGTMIAAAHDHDDPVEPRSDSSGSERSSRKGEAGTGSEPRAAAQTKDAASSSSVMDFNISKEERDSTVDEQVVNTAAISFLQSLFVHGGLHNAHWSAQRKGFCLGSGPRNPTTFQAITDGHLKVECKDGVKSAAILEVKARKRQQQQDSKDIKIEMQETAQMALWI